ncbi:amidohydrolase family protein [Sphingomicrobium aestuariivivum]|uniref:amidohydrolase family protein n=1 Tax=Sphingomicrobium aestuariivivum TaxID=1582356 RepID=UPI001FD6ADEF|nr:amidohydrolase family protein [Sphingomicrobium aestuariivivum]MCJ8191790.1 amidohydrolase family protein [Sphingomicrobium aestuariivivum]
MTRYFLAALLALVAAPADAQKFLVRNVTVIDLEGDRGLAGQDVRISDGKVVSISPHDDAELADESHVIDGTGRYLMPALIDSHVHVLSAFNDGPVSSTDVTGQLLPRYLGYGIVGLRDTGTALSELPRLRSLIERAPHAPALIAAGPVIDGARNQWTKDVAVNAPDAATATAVANQLADAGVDFLKVYDNLPPDAHAAIGAVARERGLPLAGHMIFGLTPDAAIANGQRFFEHVYVNIVDDCSDNPADARLQVLQAWFSGWGAKLDKNRQFLAARDTKACDVLFGRWAEAGVAITPMLTMELPTNRVALPTGRLAVHRRAMDGCSRSLAGANAIDPVVAEAATGELFEVVRQLHDAGVAILAGSDNGGDCRADGYALHRELQLLVEAGLSPRDALASATRVPAQRLGFEDLGHLAPGAAAELLLLDGNPLVDVANTLLIAGLFHDGAFHDAATLAGWRHGDPAAPQPSE